MTRLNVRIFKEEIRHENENKLCIILPDYNVRGGNQEWNLEESIEMMWDAKLLAVIFYNDHSILKKNVIFAEFLFVFLIEFDCNSLLES